MCVKYAQLCETLVQWQVPSKESFSSLEVFSCVREKYWIRGKKMHQMVRTKKGRKLRHLLRKLVSKFVSFGEKGEGKGGSIFLQGICCQGHLILKDA